MKKIFPILILALVVLSLGVLTFVSASTDEGVVLYVKEGGTGDGSSAAKALPSIYAANEIATKMTEDVTIKFVGKVTIDGTDTEKFVGNYYNEARHTNTITWAGVDASSNLTFITAKDAPDSAAKYWSMGGNLKIENIAIDVSGHKVFVIVTNLHDIEVGEGVTVLNPTNESETISIYGALEATYEDSPYYNCYTGVHTANPKITVRSGSFKQIVPYLGNASNRLTEAKSGKPTVKLDGDVTVSVSGADTYIYQLYAVCNSYNTVNNCTITLDGGIIGRFVAATDRKYSAGIGRYGASGSTGIYTLYLTKNFDITKQEYLVGDANRAEFMYALCGVTANKDYAGGVDNELLGVHYLVADEEIYDGIKTAFSKINFDSFDKLGSYNGEKVTWEGEQEPPPETSEPTTNAPETTTEPETTTASDTMVEPDDTKHEATTSSAPEQTSTPIDTVESSVVTQQPSETETPSTETQTPSSSKDSDADSGSDAPGTGDTLGVDEGASTKKASNKKDNNDDDDDDDRNNSDDMQSMITAIVIVAVCAVAAVVVMAIILVVVVSKKKQ